ncbi:putative transposase [Cotonvirus japonicus]|uniref:Transposase n=1 Tax=Cotonvirus japonicus TaxID=2811091 RepID=A0ABM7NRB8_9VIRU|nr:putative transposase [Cotonvirus japonicus]BCS82708.1 putative transposase [Cotonvirus japonicus]
MNSLTGFLNNSAVSSFASTNHKKNHLNKNYLKTLCQLSQNSQPNAKQITASRKIRIFPGEEHIDLFNKCFGATRYIYNKTLDAIKSLYKSNQHHLKKKAKKGCVHMVSTRQTNKKSGSKTTKTITKQCCNNLSSKYMCSKHSKRKPKIGVPLNFQYWRNLLIKSNEDLPENEKWMSEIPYDTRQLVIKNILTNYKSAITNLKNGNINSFDVKYKTRKNKNQFFFVDYRAIKEDLSLWKNKIFGALGMRKGEIKWFDEYMKKYFVKNFNKEKPKKGTKRKSKDLYERKDMIITREYPGMYYLHIPYTKEIPKQPIKKESIVSIDPGVRSFHAFYDPEGSCGKIGDGLASKIISMYEKVDNLISKITKTNTENNDLGYKTNKRRRQNMRKQCAWLRTKIKNIVKDHHWKTASYYCSNYKYIVIPKLDTDSLKRRIRKTFKFNKSSPMIRKMMVLSHSKFIERLQYKSQEHGSHILVVDEHYTSMTCGNCGMLHKKLGSNKIFKCPYCKEIIDRDVNGARNILIKTLCK